MAHYIVKSLIVKDVITMIMDKYSLSEREAEDKFYTSIVSDWLSDDSTGLYGYSPLRIFSLFEEQGIRESFIKNEDELLFAVFCIEHIAISLKTTGDKVYAALTEKSDILNGYIIPCYDILHTQGKNYIVEDIISVMKSRGVTI